LPSVTAVSGRGREPAAGFTNPTTPEALHSRPRKQYREQDVQRRFRNLDRPRPPASTSGPEPPPSLGLGEDLLPAPSLPPVSRRATSRLAPILSHLQRAARIPLRQLGTHTRVSASYLSRVLCGEKFPSWELTERFARACGADPMALRKVWEDEKLSGPATPAPDAFATAPTTVQAVQVRDALIEPLHSALRSLHRLAGSPSARAIASVAGDGLTPEQVTELLEGACVPDWSSVCRFVHVLDAEPTFFQPLWEAAHRATAHLEDPPSRSLPAPSSPAWETAVSTSERLATLMQEFGRTLTKDPKDIFMTD
jgi:transcriptional regulator with XRE-family HTH domain